MLPLSSGKREGEYLMDLAPHGEKRVGFQRNEDSPRCLERRLGCTIERWISKIMGNTLTCVLKLFHRYAGGTAWKNSVNFFGYNRTTFWRGDIFWLPSSMTVYVYYFYFRSHTIQYLLYLDPTARMNWIHFKKKCDVSIVSRGESFTLFDGKTDFVLSSQFLI